MKSFNILIFVIVLACSFSYAQEDNIEKINPFGQLELSTGIGISSGEHLNMVYGSGFGLNVGYKFNVYKNKIFVGPSMQYSRWVNNLNKSTKDVLTQFGRSIELSLSYLEYKDVLIYPIIGFGYIKVDNEFSPRSGYQGATIKGLTGNGAHLAYGLGVEYRNIVLQIRSFVFNPVMKMSDQMKDSFNGISQIYDPYTFGETKMNLGYVSIMIGYNFKFN